MRKKQIPVLILAFSMMVSILAGVSFSAENAPTITSISLINSSGETMRDGEVLEGGDSFYIDIEVDESQYSLYEKIPGSLLLKRQGAVSDEYNVIYGSYFYKRNNGGYRALYSVDEDLCSGIYSIEYCELSYLDDGNVENVFYEKDTAVFQNINVAVRTSRTDGDPPVISRIESASGTYETGDTITVNVWAEDSASGIGEENTGIATITLIGSIGTFGDFHEMFHKTAEGYYQAVFTVTDEWPSGTYCLDSLSIYDQDNNSCAVSEHQNEELYTQIEQIEYEIVTNYTEPEEDETPPVISGIKISVPYTQELHSGDSFDVTVYAEDETAINDDAGHVSMERQAKEGERSISEYEDLVKVRDGEYKASFHVTEEWYAGEYCANIVIYDSSYNRGEKTDDNLLKIATDKTDAVPPKISKWEIGGEYKMGDTVEVTVYASDNDAIDEEDPGTVELYNAPYQYPLWAHPTANLRKVSEGEYKATFQTTNEWSPGEYAVYAIFVNDRTGNTGIINWEYAGSEQYFYLYVNEEITEGWKKDSKGWWYQNADGSYPVSKWQNINQKWYHFDENGYMQTGWLKIGDKWYYLKENGAMVTDWMKIDSKWYYFASDGTMITGWQKINEIWYYFDKGGTMATGWREVSGVWYYFDQNGHMVSGWKQLNGKWYYFDKGGTMATGWRQVNDTWYYFESNGAMDTGWQKINDTWYYFDPGGAMATGWRKINDKWYYFNQSGSMATGWREVNDAWYYFQTDGSMVTSKWVGDYYLKENGAMAKDEWIGNYYVDKNGKWVPSK